MVKKTHPIYQLTLLLLIILSATLTLGSGLDFLDVLTKQKLIQALLDTIMLTGITVSLIYLLLKTTH